MAGKNPVASGSGRVVADDDIARETREYGFLQLDPKVDPDISVDDLEQVSREDRREQMDLYFRATIDVFEADRTSGGRTWVVRLTRVVALVVSCMIGLVATLAVAMLWAELAVGAALALALAAAWTVWLWRRNDFLPATLWPGFFEERLSQFTERRFGENGRDMRELILRLMTVFRRNLWTFIWHKRVHQAWTSALAAAAPFVPYWMPADWMPADDANALLLKVAIAFAMLLVASGFFFYINGRLHEHYKTALEHSAREVSIKINQRMKSLSQVITQYITKLQETQQKGEKFPGGATSAAQLENMRDEQLQDGTGFFYTQAILFLAKRNEHLELFLWDQMHRSRRIHMLLDAAGLALTILILVLVAAYPMVALGTNGASMLEAFGRQPSLQDVAFTLLSIAALALIYLFAERSYASPSWTSGSNILQGYFGTSDWDTYAKLKIDVKLAARFQRAIYWIRDLFELRRER